MVILYPEMGVVLLVNIVNRSRSRLTSCLLRKQARHQCDVCTPSSDCLVVYNQFVTAAILFEFLESIKNIQLPVWKRGARQVPRLVFYDSKSASKLAMTMLTWFADDRFKMSSSNLTTEMVVFVKANISVTIVYLTVKDDPK